MVTKVLILFFIGCLLCSFSKQCAAQISHDWNNTFESSRYMHYRVVQEAWPMAVSPQERINNISPGLGTYDGDTLSEMHRLCKTSDCGDDKLSGKKLLMKALMCVPIMGTSNRVQLFLRPQHDVSVTLLKRISMSGFVRAARVTTSADTIAVDTHVHTCYSHDSLSDISQLLISASKKGLAGIAITDHDTMEGVHKAGHIAAQLIAQGKLPDSFFIIPGQEISTSKGHIVGLYLSHSIPSNLSPEEAVKAIHDQGGIAIAAHPLLQDGLHDLANSLPFDAVETRNGAEEVHNASAHRKAKEKRKEFYAKVSKPHVGGSDAHDPGTVGMCYTVLNCAPNPEAVRSALLSGHTEAASAISDQKINRLAKGGLPVILSSLDMVNGMNSWLRKTLHASNAGFSLFPNFGFGAEWHLNY